MLLKPNQGFAYNERADKFLFTNNEGILEVFNGELSASNLQALHQA